MKKQTTMKLILVATAAALALSLGACSKKDKDAKQAEALAEKNKETLDALKKFMEENCKTLNGNVECDKEKLESFAATNLSLKDSNSRTGIVKDSNDGGDGSSGSDNSLKNESTATVKIGGN